MTPPSRGTQQKGKLVRTNLTRALAVLASSLLLFIGILISAPANAADNTVTVTIQANGVPEAYGFLYVYTYDDSVKNWHSASYASTNASGLAQISLASGQTYRFCFRGSSINNSESFCWGGDIAAEATSVTLNSDLNLGTVNLHAKQVIDMSRVRILGRPVVGQWLTADLSSLPAGVNHSTIEWFQDAVMDGMDINGQPISFGNLFYKVKPSDVGHTISIAVSASGPRLISQDQLATATTRINSTVGPVVLPMSLSRAPRVTVKKWKKGRTVSYVPPSVTPPDATATFQWLRSGKPIKGANKANYVIKKADRKKRLTLRITYTQAGYETTTMQTPPSPKIK
jgi:hypothetical protein